ncbi:Clan ME, family M16, insulinase-like metallopeptidase [Tritrichomonas foetus]|uniref:Clan ME, family M16, insulinase-like metallopeptidase n=1 Tax=Tritrichomonas foetus TaxID=1144522 RepID=A0A1J4KYK8_9EUKA|nr:Clan ME, family M16, insulinase-like metallopeptidase [Tritrichomonas foetus]|eukprot:OHT15960.1 Clan ME, family M16, insulinase-like metallopeptidase [Tritrichomonas foetus]
MAILAPTAIPKITTLTNGLRVATIPIQSELSTIGIWVKSGSIYENAKNNGTAHYLEHMIFRGNEKYPQSQLEEIADLKGINLRAATTRTTTSFSAKISNNNFGLAADIISQIVLNPRIAKTDVENERYTILTEEYEVKHNYSETLWDLLHSLAFEKSPVSFPILGTKDTITSISAEMIKEHHEKFFNPSNCIFVCATNMEHEKCVEHIDKATTFIKKRPPLNIDAIDNSVKVDFTPNVRMFSSNFLDRSWMSCGVEAPCASSVDFPTCQLMKEAIGTVEPELSMESSPLLKSAAVDQVTLHYQPYGRSGILGFLGYTQFGREQEWLNSVINSITKATVEITEENLKMAKNRAKYVLAKNLSSSFCVADELGINLHLVGKWRSINEWNEIFEKITKESLSDFAMGYFYKKTPACALIVKAQQQQEQAQQQQPAQQQQKSKIIRP